MPASVINHYILIKYKRDTPREHIERFCQKMLALGEELPTVKKLEMGLDIVHDDRSWDLLISMQLSSIDTLRDYQAHPSHKAVIAFNHPYVDDVASIDFSEVITALK